MSKRISNSVLSEIKNLRQMGWSMPEIKKKFTIGYGTIYRHIKSRFYLSIDTCGKVRGVEV